MSHMNKSIDWLFIEQSWHQAASWTKNEEIFICSKYASSLGRKWMTIHLGEPSKQYGVTLIFFGPIYHLMQREKIWLQLDSKNLGFASYVHKRGLSVRKSLQNLRY